MRNSESNLKIKSLHSPCWSRRNLFSLSLLKLTDSRQMNGRKCVEFTVCSGALHARE